jgi:hypothetical protein
MLAYTPFLDPLPVWASSWGWPALLLPMCAAVAVVYKAIKCKYVNRIARESVVLFVMIVLGMMAAAGALAVLARVME